METEHKELSPDAVAQINEWLQDSTETGNEIIIPLPLDTPLKHLPEVMAVLDSISFEYVLIKRTRFNFNNRWWLEVAYRADTDEPIAFVSHQGNIQEYLTELWKREKSI